MKHLSASYPQDDSTHSLNLILSKLKAMLDIQNSLNSRVNTDWKSAGYKFRDAAMVEAIELFDHLPWKWWKFKKGPVDVGQVQMEAVDIWHFILSEVICQNSSDLLVFTAEAIKAISKAKPSTWDISSIGDDVRQFVNVCSSEKEDKDTYEVISTFIILINSVGLSFDDLYKLYVGKAKLNQFRWANDYGNTYIKNWSLDKTKPLEDNQYLTQVLESFDIDDPSFPTKLSSALAFRYMKVEEFNKE